MLSAAIRDLRHALRSLQQQPGFLLVAVLTLALGIGANTAMFSVIHAVMITPLPYAEPDRLVRIWETNPEGGRFSASDANYLDFAERNRSFSELAAARDVSYTLLGGDEPIRLDGLAVTGNFFRALGAVPRLGAGFPDAGSAVRDSASVVLSHKLWQRRFAGDPRTVGQQIVLEGRSHRVVGVMGADFDFVGAEFWVPLRIDPGADRGDHWLAMVGRLRDGVSLAQARQDLSAIAAALSAEYPTNAGWGIDLLPFDRWLVLDSVRQTLQLLFAAVAALLLMACVNLASLLFVRNQKRRAEIGLRAALGAGRAHLARLMVVEVLLLVGLGVLLALPVAQFAISALKLLAVGSVPRLHGVQIDPDVFAFSVALGLFTGVLLALLPVWQAQRVQPSESLRLGERDGVPPAQRRLGDFLVVAQVALAMVLLVGAGLLLSSFLQLRQSDPGFNPDQLLSAELQLGDRYPEPWQKVVFFNQLQQRLQALPGVHSASASNTLPFSGGSFMNEVTPIDRVTEVQHSGLLQAHWRAVTPGFFATVGLPLLRGRVFDSGDSWDGPRWVVLSRTLAERLWPDQDPIGRELYWGAIGGRPRIVAGVVGDYQDVHLGAEPEPVMFLPYNQLPWPRMSLLVRGRGDPEALVAAVRGEIHALDPGLPVTGLRPLRQQLTEAAAVPRLRTALLGAFAVVALLLAAIGSYGVMAANLVQRRREFGLRMALGAPPGSMVALLLSRGARLAAIGLLIGLAATWAMTRLLQGLLYGTSPLEPMTLIAAVLLLSSTVMLASYLPARRAARLDPMLALRQS